MGTCVWYDKSPRSLTTAPALSETDNFRFPTKGGKLLKTDTCDRSVLNKVSWNWRIFGSLGFIIWVPLFRLEQMIFIEVFTSLKVTFSVRTCVKLERTFWWPFIPRSYVWISTLKYQLNESYFTFERLIVISYYKFDQKQVKSKIQNRSMYKNRHWVRKTQTI